VNKPSAWLVLPLVLALFAGPAAAFPIGGTHTKEEIRSKCAANGGVFTSNLDVYSCFVKNCDGKGGHCGVSCSASDGQCEGTVPPSRVGGSKGAKFDLNTTLSKQVN
jgi:hypothetical protein